MLVNRLKSALIVTASAGALLLGLASSASAVPFTIDGITLGEGALFKTTTIWENIVTVPGTHLTGIGRVESITSGDCPAGLCWTNGDNLRELTFAFDYTLETIGVPPSGGGEAWFSGGIINLFVGAGATRDFTAYTPPAGLAPGQAADFLSATNGTPFLNLVGGPTGTVCDPAGAKAVYLAPCFSGPGTPIVLESTFSTAGGLGAVLAGAGHGFLNVTAGLGEANAYFNTNTYPLGNDILIDTTFAADVTGSDFPLRGGAVVSAFVVNVPEPATLALFGFGLLGMGFMVRRRNENVAKA